MIVAACEASSGLLNLRYERLSFVSLPSPTITKLSVAVHRNLRGRNSTVPSLVEIRTSFSEGVTSAGVQSVPPLVVALSVSRSVNHDRLDSASNESRWTPPRVGPMIERSSDKSRSRCYHSTTVGQHMLVVELILVPSKPKFRLARPVSRFRRIRRKRFRLLGICVLALVGYFDYFAWRHLVYGQLSFGQWIGFGILPLLSIPVTFFGLITAVFLLMS
jgi:hypothetical protein